MFKITDLYLVIVIPSGSEICNVNVIVSVLNLKHSNGRRVRKLSVKCRNSRALYKQQIRVTIALVQWLYHGPYTAT